MAKHVLLSWRKMDTNTRKGCDQSRIKFLSFQVTLILIGHDTNKRNDNVTKRRKNTSCDILPCFKKMAPDISQN